MPPETKQISLTDYCKEYKAYINVTERTIRKAAEKNNLSMLPQVEKAEKIGRNYVLTVSC
jgi:hypothetical protein